MGQLPQLRPLQQAHPATRVRLCRPCFAARCACSGGAARAAPFRGLVASRQAVWHLRAGLNILGTSYINQLQPCPQYDVLEHPPPPGTCAAAAALDTLQPDPQQGSKVSVHGLLLLCTLRASWHLLQWELPQPWRHAGRRAGRWAGYRSSCRQEDGRFCRRAALVLGARKISMLNFPLVARRLATGATQQLGAAVAAGVWRGRVASSGQAGTQRNRPPQH